jgi:hypothetical protein
VAFALFSTCTKTRLTSVALCVAILLTVVFIATVERKQRPASVNRRTLITMTFHAIAAGGLQACGW